MTEPPPLPREEVIRILVALGPLSDQRRIVLIGGQAVAFWSSYLRIPGSSDEARIYTSKDIDFEGARRWVHQAGSLLDGKVRLPSMDDHTPNTGVVVFDDADGVAREVDFLEAPFGLTARDVRHTAVLMEIPDPGSSTPASVWVMHPERCMESRVCNVVELRQDGAIAMDQLRRSVACARAWAEHLLDDESVGQRTRVRAVLDLNERIFRKCIQDKRFRDVYLDHAVDPFEAVLVDERLPKKFRELRYPQMLEKLEDRRNRDREHRRRYVHRRRKRKR